MVEATRLYAGKKRLKSQPKQSICVADLSVPITSDFSIFFIYSPEFGCISFRTSGLCETNEPLTYDHLPKCIR